MKIVLTFIQSQLIGKFEKKNTIVRSVLFNGVKMRETQFGQNKHAKEKSRVMADVFKQLNFWLGWKSL